MRPFLCALLFAAPSLSVLGQAPADRYDALKQALGLTDSQMSQLQQKSPAPIAADPAPRSASRSAGDFGRLQFPPPWDSSRRDRILDSSQQTRLAAIEKVLSRYEE